MIEMLKLYFKMVWHPFNYHKDLKKIRFFRSNAINARPLHLADSIDREWSNPNYLPFRKLNWTEIISISWVFYLIHSIYSIILLNSTSISSSQLDDPISSLIVGAINRFGIYLALLQVVFFPLAVWATSKIWVLVINFYGQLFEEDDDWQRSVDDVVGQSVVSHFFLIIPVIGQVLTLFGQIFFMYAGLRRNLGMGRKEAYLVLLTPFFTILILGLMLLGICAMSLNFLSNASI